MALMTNNKQQSAMKLYTEEQVMEMINKCQATGLNADYLLLTTPHLELPSDEEIEASKFPLNSPEQELWNGGYEEGAKWMRNKIQGGEQ
jgi:hypothetical protein